MNRLRIDRVETGADELRPPREFWGPAGGRETDPDVARELAAGLPRPDRCPICDGPGPQFVLTAYGWPIHDCSACGGGFVWPTPSPELLSSFYSSRYWARYLGSEEPLYDRPALRTKILLRQAQCLDRLIGGDRSERILDVGTGDGSMLRVLADLGYRNTLGIDVDESNCRRARERLGVRALQADFLDFRQDGWDAITMWGVIEHLLEPRRYLAHAASLLAPGGLALVMTGDNSSWQARVQGTVDMWVYPPEHLFYFGRRSLARVFERSGFTGVRCRLQFQSRPKEAVLWGLRMVQALKARLRPPVPSWRGVSSNLLVAWGRRGRA